MAAKEPLLSPALRRALIADEEIAGRRHREYVQACPACQIRGYGCFYNGVAAASARQRPR